jgi:hypothetical protein
LTDTRPLFKAHGHHLLVLPAHARTHDLFP